MVSSLVRDISPTRTISSLHLAKTLQLCKALWNNTVHHNHTENQTIWWLLDVSVWSHLTLAASVCSLQYESENKERMLFKSGAAKTFTAACAQGYTLEQCQSHS